MISLKKYKTTTLYEKNVYDSNHDCTSKGLIVIRFSIVDVM